jgi:hypothetical protein
MQMVLWYYAQSCLRDSDDHLDAVPVGQSFRWYAYMNGGHGGTVDVAIVGSGAGIKTDPAPNSPGRRHGVIHWTCRHFL